ncbi:MAG: transposase [Chitinispirillales bacterium]|nr:transposase [Chitinispirillales bacterium]
MNQEVQGKQYQFSKTLRFGLTSTNQNLYSEETMRLLKVSQEKIEKQVKKENNNTDKTNQLRNCLVQIKEYLKTWDNTYPQIDFLAITKDYYKVISRKARFDFDKGNGSEIKLSSLQSMYNNKKRYQYITDFWKENLHKTENLYRKSDDLLRIFEEAEKQNREDKKLNKVELRKTFLSLFNLVNESLKPLIEGNLFIVNDEKIDEQNPKHNYVSDFILKAEARKPLYNCIGNLQNYFKDNGGYVPFGRVTLNKWTALQKSNNRDTKINRIIKELKINSFLIKNINYKYNEFTSNFKEKKDKKGKIVKNKDGDIVWELEPNDKSVIELCQFFKYKKIPINACLNLAKRLIKENKLEKEKENTFLSELGVSKSPALDYKKDQSNFSLTNYPLKVAFDYAWENCAKAKYEDIPFPKKQCEKYLRDVFDLDIETNADFAKYALLLRFKILIGRIKVEETTRIENIATIKEFFNDVKSNLTKEKDKTVAEINNWLTFKENQTDKKAKYSNQDEFSEAMKTIGEERGGLKSKISRYKALTDMFKVCSSKFGKQFADLRDYFNEAYEVDKIKYRAWIIEDDKKNRFVLLADKGKEVGLTSGNGDLYFYEVKSLTSKSLVKFIKNKGAYPDFHNKKSEDGFCQIYLNSENKENKDRFIDDVKIHWSTYKNDQEFLKKLKECLKNSKMAIEQNWNEFNFDFSECDNYEKLEKEIDRKGYKFERKAISLTDITDLVENKECLLLPIVNHDINKEKQTENQSQFTKDWFAIFKNKKHLHPEFNIFYRFQTKDYLKTKFKNGTEKTKRYSRFQMLAHFGCEVIPQGDYLSKKEQIAIFNDDEKQKKEVENFKENISSDFDYVIGIDRGIKQLATLCVLDKKGVIQGDFQIFTRKFNDITKKWEHKELEKRNILDLSNLRVETTIAGEKVLVDLASIKTKKGENQQKIKLKELAYIRELQYAMQTRKDELLDFANKINSADDITEDSIKNFISPYKEGTRYADLPKSEFFNRLTEWKNADDKGKLKVAELDSADNLKSGIVANMIGVIAFLCEKYKYKVRISLEDLTRAYGIQKDALSGTAIYQNDEDFKEQENRRLAGVGTMQFFEMQLLRKLFKIQIDEKLCLIPSFRSVANYEKIVRRDRKSSGDKFVNYPFGIVCFVDPSYTSQKCPYCDNKHKKNDKETGKKAFYRDKGENKNSLLCKQCGVSTIKGQEKPSNKNDSKKQFNIHFITNGDENGAYHIAKKTLNNLIPNNKNNKNQPSDFPIGTCT